MKPAQPSSQRHILRVIPSYFPYVTGPANQAREIACRLMPLGFASRIVTTNLGAPSAPSRETLDGIEVLRASIQAGVMQYHIALGSIRELQRQPANIIHVHSYRSFLADAAAVAARLRNVPLILQLHGSLVGYKHIVQGSGQWFYKAFDAVTRPFPTLRADRIIVSTTQEAHEVAQYGLPRNRIHVIPMGIDPDQYTFTDVRRDPMAITFVGRLAADRNVEQLLHALALIPDLPWSCSIVGSEERRSYASAPGYVDHLRRLASELGLRHRVTFTGALYGEHLRRHYAGAGIFVYPSRYENFGQTILEAAAAGCVPVTTRVGVANDLVQDGASGFLVGWGVPGELARHVRWLLEHPVEQVTLGQKVRALVQQDYAWAPILRCYAHLYADVTRRAIPRRVAGSTQSKAMAAED